MVFFIWNPPRQTAKVNQKCGKKRVQMGAFGGAEPSLRHRFGRRAARA
jgi:hypothetical protein